MTIRQSISKDLANYIWDRDTPFCAYCESRGQQIDHILPVKHGGPTVKGNLVLACISCNMRKLGKLSIEHLTVGFFHVLSKGESIEWLDKIEPNKKNQRYLSGLSTTLNVPSAKKAYHNINPTKFTAPPPVDKEPIEIEEKMPKIVTCECGCGEDFVPTRSWQKYKDTSHRNAAFKKVSLYSKDFRCPHCGRLINENSL